jgi:hypothetical protein
VTTQAPRCKCNNCVMVQHEGEWWCPHMGGNEDDLFYLVHRWQVANDLPGWLRKYRVVPIHASPVDAADAAVADIERLLDAPIKFGLSVQSHIPTIRRMLNEGRPWAAIADAIGWDRETARAWYLQTIIDDLGFWASAGMDDDSGACDELKEIFERVLEASTKEENEDI